MLWAKSANLSNVIHVHEPYLHTMGFNSLRNVSGPGEIFLSFEKYQETYIEIYIDKKRYHTEGRECFSIKEMEFLARHPQFFGKMYRACETTDPCFRPELFKDLYTFEDIPDNCTTFAGMVCIVGPYPQDLPSFKKFKNLTLLIGQLQVGLNLFSSLEMFENLEVIYPYMNGNILHPCYDNIFSFEENRGIQSIFVGLGRFLKNISLPSLSPYRPLVINQPSVRAEYEFDYILYFPERVPDRCGQFDQFADCHLGRRWDVDDNAPRDVPYVEDAWLVGILFVGIGLWYGKRCLVGIATRQLQYSFGKSQYLIATVFLVMVLSAMEAVVINQVAYDTMNTKYGEHYIFSQFNSPRLLHPFSQEIIRFLAACRQTSLITLIFCYFNIIISSSWKRWREHYSRVYIIFATILSIIALIYFESQLVIEIRAVRPHYNDPDVIYMAFVMNAAGHQNFTRWSPAYTVVPIRHGYIEFITYLPEYTEDYVWNFFGPNDMHLETVTGAFPEISLYCDFIFICLAITFFTLKIADCLDSKENHVILIILYAQMSMNRIRSFISYDILTEFIDHATGEHILQDRLFLPEKSLRDYVNAIWIIMRILEKLPYFSFMIVSYLCWNHIQYYRLMELALIYREEKEKEAPSLSESTISDFYSSFITVEQ